MLHPSKSYRADWSYVIHGRLDFHRAALTKLHCAYNQKLGAPVCSTLLDDFDLLASSWRQTTGVTQVGMLQFGI